MFRDPLHEAQAAEVEAARPWARWSAWWKRRARDLKVAASIVTAASGIAGGIQAIRLALARDVGRPDQPKGTGMATLATDRVERPDASK